MTDLPRHDHPPDEHGHVAALLAELGRAPVPPPVERRLAAALDAALPQRAPRRRGLFPRGLGLPRLLVPVAGLAAVALVVVVGGDLVSRGGGATSESARDAAPATYAAEEAAAPAPAPAADASGGAAASSAAAGAVEAMTTAAGTFAADAETSAALAAQTAVSADALLDALAPYRAALKVARTTADAADRRATRTLSVPRGTGPGAILRHYAEVLGAEGWTRLAGTTAGLGRFERDGAVLVVDARRAADGRYRLNVALP